ncbi:MAG TPA: hypothetical protein VFE84_00030 [Patescibacteria group bacterium]|nr:hypothetical protein [Patescibacteria group bacterium]
MKDKDALLEEMRGRLDDYKSRLATLKKGLFQVTGATAARFDEQMTSLRDEIQQTREKAHALAQPGDREWQDITKGFDHAWRELRESFETATTHYQ